MFRRLVSLAGFVLGSVLAAGACSPVFWQGFAEGMAAAETTRGAPTMPAGRLSVFGGPDHQTYLGCLSCSRYDASSVFNQYGEFGNKYSMTSIANKYGDFGSKYNVFSACNPYASDPPIVVTDDGHAVGRLTLNKYAADRIASPEIVRWLVAVCAD